MLRYGLVVALGLGLTGPASATPWADGMFDQLSRDFGSVPRGTIQTHAFRVVNKTGTPVHIANVRASCGCVTARALQHDLAPGQETSVYVTMDTGRFQHSK